MIAKGKIRGEGGKLASYLLAGGRGEQAELLDMRGFRHQAHDLIEGFRQEEEHAAATRADKPFFHVQIRGANGEGRKLTREQWLEIADGCDLALGRAMTQQPRGVSLHIDSATGDMHMHLAYSLVRQSEDGRAYVQKLGLYETKLQLYAREIEEKYGLQILSNEPRPGARRADRNELEESRRLGTDVHAIRTAILDCLEHADSGKAFKAALEERSLMLANGDRRDCFVVIDEASGHHALNKKLTGMTLAEVRDRLADLDRTQLPSVDQAQEIQRERQHQREIDRAAEQAMQGAHAEAKGRYDAIRPDRAGQTIQPDYAAAKGRRDEIQPNRYAEIDRQAEQAMQAARAAAQGRTDDINPQPEIKPLGKTAGEIRLAWQLTATADQFAQTLEDRGLILVHVSREEAEASHRAHAFAKAIDRQSRELKEGFAVVDQRGNVTRIDQRTTGDHLEEIQKRLGGIDKSELVSVADAKEIMAEANRAAWVARQRAEQEQARPPSWIESRIAETADQTRQGVTDAYVDSEYRRVSHAEVLADLFKPADEQQIRAVRVYGRAAFETRLEEAGIAIARVTDADLKGLDALRHDESMARIAAETNNEAYKPHHFAADLVAGDVAAVTRAGDVYRINPEKIGDAAQHIAAELPGVIETRARFELEQISALWDQRRADATVARQDFAAEREGHHQAAETARDVRQVEQNVGEAVDTGLTAASKGGSSFAAAVEKGLSGVFSFFGDSEPKLTPLQQELAARAGEERHAEQTAAADRARVQADYDRIAEAQRTKDIANFLQVDPVAPTAAELWGTPKPRAQQEREKEQDRDYERDR